MRGIPKCALLLANAEVVVSTSTQLNTKGREQKGAVSFSVQQSRNHAITDHGASEDHVDNSPRKPANW
jgi:hypothetical protein